MLSNPSSGIILTQSEVCRRSWWELNISAPTGEMPSDGQYKLRNLPDIMSKIGAQQYTSVNSRQAYPHLKEAVGCTALGIHLYESDQLADFFKEWYKKVYDPETEAVGLYSDVVGQGTLKLYIPGQGSPTEARTIKLVDCWPSGISIGSVDRDSDGEPLKYTVNLEVMDIDFG